MTFLDVEFEIIFCNNIYLPFETFTEINENKKHKFSFVTIKINYT